MKVTDSWLREYVDFDLGARELAERLTLAGLEVETMEETDDGVVYDVETTSNRPDHLGMVGVAREVAVALRREFRLPPNEFAEEGPSIEELTSVENLDVEGCPRYTARLIEGIRVGPSPDWLRDRLEAIGLRPVNNIVDITNFVLFEYGQPLHAFDF